jgi:hypothetical protein
MTDARAWPPAVVALQIVDVSVVVEHEAGIVAGQISVRDSHERRSGELARRCIGRSSRGLVVRLQIADVSVVG